MARMNFLQIVQRCYYESGIGGTGPVSVIAQTGRNADFVRWVQTAFEEIWNLRDNWNFAWRTSEPAPFNLTNGKDDYDPVADLGITSGVAEWVRDGAYVYVSSLGVNSRHWLAYIEWERFRQLPVPVVPGFPNIFTTQPDGVIRYYPRPEQAYLAVHEYHVPCPELEANTDVPAIPDRFHMAIVWKAVMLYANFNKDWSRHDSAEEEYHKIMDALYQREQPKWQMAGALL